MAPEMEERFQTLHEIVKAARQNLAPGPWDYLAGGAETETTLRRNRLALDSLAFRPRVLRDVSKIDCTVDVLRPASAHPGDARAHRLDRELRRRAAAPPPAKASAEFGVPQMLSSVCNPGLEAIAAAADNFRIFQLYVRGDDACVDDHVKRAARPRLRRVLHHGGHRRATAGASATSPGASSSRGARAPPARTTRPRSPGTRSSASRTATTSR